MPPSTRSPRIQTAAALCTLVYVSNARQPLQPGQLDRLLMRSREFNAEVGVTGVLLHHDGSFLQLLEGSPAGLARVWARITTSLLHDRVTELMHEPVAERHFADWHMGFAEAPASAIQAIAQARWLAGVQALDRPEPAADGLALLLGFWQRARRRRPSASSTPSAPRSRA